LQPVTERRQSNACRNCTDGLSQLSKLVKTFNEQDGRVNFEPGTGHKDNGDDLTKQFVPHRKHSKSPLLRKTD
jgi:hypothetical protein